MIKSLLALCLVGVVAAWADGQTSTDFSAKYPEFKAHEVRPGILMTEKYATDGQVCEVTLEKRHSTLKGVNLGSTIPSELTKQLVDEVIPPADRGKRVGPFSKWDYVTTISGSLITKEATYENVSIEIDGTLSSCEPGDVVVTVRWKRAACTQPAP
jgi:hypothetical protein